MSKAEKFIKWYASRINERDLVEVKKQINGCQVEKSKHV